MDGRGQRNKVIIYGHGQSLGERALHISLIDPMIDQKNAGIESFFGVKIRKNPCVKGPFFRVSQ